MSQELETNSQEKKMTFSGFQKGIQAILPLRFDKNDLEFLWEKISENSSSVNFTKFQQVFGNNQFAGTQYVSPNK